MQDNLCQQIDVEIAPPTSARHELLEMTPPVSLTKKRDESEIKLAGIEMRHTPSVSPSNHIKSARSAE